MRTEPEKEIYATGNKARLCRVALRWPCCQCGRPLPANDKERVLRSLDAAAAKFHSTSADFEFDSVISAPISQTTVQKGTVYYERKGKAFQTAAHISETDGNRKNPVVYSYSNGVFQLYQKATNQVTTFSKASQYEAM